MPLGVKIQELKPKFNKKAVLPQGNRAMLQVFFSRLKFANGGAENAGVENEGVECVNWWRRELKNKCT